MINISEKFKIIRKALHLSQAEFAKPLKISDKQISAIENGRVETSQSVMELLFSSYLVNRIWWDSGEGEIFVTRDIQAKPIVSEKKEPYKQQEDDRPTDEVEKMILRKMRKRGKAYQFRWLASVEAEEEAESKNNPAS